MQGRVAKRTSAQWPLVPLHPQKPMPSAQITCINKSDRQNPHERITHVGGFMNGQRWRITQEEAIRFIETRQRDFYVNPGNDPVLVIVAVSRFGNQYLKTQNDGDQPNNLLSLASCPI